MDAELLRGLVAAVSEVFGSRGGTLALDRNDPRVVRLNAAIEAASQPCLSVAQGQGWRPIESAPRARNLIIVGGGTVGWDSESGGGDCAFSGVAIVAWDFMRNAWRGASCGGHDEYFWHRPTHWQPLPAAPAQPDGVE